MFEKSTFELPAIFFFLCFGNHYLKTDFLTVDKKTMTDNCITVFDIFFFAKNLKKRTTTAEGNVGLRLAVCTKVRSRKKKKIWEDHVQHAERLNRKKKQM